MRGRGQRRVTLFGGTVGSLSCALTLAGAVAALGMQTARPPTARPLEVGQVEQVQVHLVLLDVTVLDRRDRTVPGLGLEDFDVLVGHQPVELDTLDVHCPLGAAGDPRANEVPLQQEALDASGPPRQLVHAFDYLHLASAAEALRDARAALARLASSAERHMVVSIGNGLRVEAPFTEDLAAVDGALRRMARDPALYAGNYGRLTERRFYRALIALLDLLDTVAGAKTVLLYSGPFAEDGFTYDTYFREIAGLAAKARVALYTVDTGGLRAPIGFSYGDLGAPARLARLAHVTGGRVTYNTNDIGLAYARAQRDLGCRYTLGFHDRAPRPDRARRVAVFVRRRGVRVIHPTSYVLRSDEARRRALVESALMAPELFDGGGITVAVVPLGQRAPRRRLVRVAIDVPRSRLDGLDRERWRLEGRITTADGARVRRLARQTPNVADAAQVFDDVELKVGRYRASVVLSHPGLLQPFAAYADFELAEADSTPAARER